MRKLADGHRLQYQTVGFRFRQEQHAEEKRSNENEQHVLRQLRVRVPGNIEGRPVPTERVRYLVHRRRAVRHDIRHVTIRRHDLPEIAQSNVLGRLLVAFRIGALVMTWWHYHHTRRVRLIFVRPVTRNRCSERFGSNI